MSKKKNGCALCFLIPNALLSHSPHTKTGWFFSLVSSECDVVKDIKVSAGEHNFKMIKAKLSNKYKPCQKI